MLELPRGVGLVRAEAPWGPVQLISERLTEQEALAARLIAADRIVEGHHFVWLTVTDIVLRLERVV